MRVLLVILLCFGILVVILALAQAVIGVRHQGNTFTLTVKLFGITLYPFRKTPKEKKPNPEKDAKRQAKLQEREAEKKARQERARKAFPMDKLWKLLQNTAKLGDMAGSALASLDGPAQMMMRSVAWCDIETDFVIGGEDAADCARLYGAVMSLWPLTSAANHFMPVRRKSIAVRCDFTEDTCRWDFSFQIKIRLGKALAALLWLGIRFLADRRRYRAVSETAI